ncbi:hypothetical protein [Streptomyces griseofuscus]|uniref:Uncharacterized protein n=1 Tax=Streptomyces griseofuscus TaxID=146922 RepID=A0A3R8RN08_9ACTN|nr:hypothetical protein [Streptomyces griseofuscus]RRQ87402.1 hypothetical protein CQW44_10720 [Streptomyces griseofuscus]
MTGTRHDERTPAPEPRPGTRGRRVPPVTATLFLVTGAATAARFAFPGVLAAPPLLVPSPGRQALVTAPAAVALGIPAERTSGAKGVLALYLVPAAIGEAPATSGNRTAPATPSPCSSWPERSRTTPSATSTACPPSRAR